MSDNKCKACGQWSGDGHVCPTVARPAPAVTPAGPPPLSPAGFAIDVEERVKAGNAYLMALAAQYPTDTAANDTLTVPDTANVPLNPVHVPPYDLAATQRGVYPPDADPQVVAELRDMPVRLIVVDIETTGFDPNRAQTTEIAWESLNSGDAGTFIPPHTLDGADPDSLRISRYDERIAGQPQDDGEQVRALHAFLGGDGVKTYIVGSNPSFDCAHLNTLFAKHGLSPDPWNHRKIDPAAAYWMYPDVPLGAQTGLKEATGLTGVELDGHHAAGVDVTATARIWHRLESRRRAL